MKHFKHFKKYPFITVIIASTLLLTFIGFIGKNNVYAVYSADWWKVPQLAVVLEGMKDGNYPWKIAVYKEENAAGSNGAAHEEDSGTITVAHGEKGSEDTTGKAETSKGSTSDNNKTDNGNTADNTGTYYNQPAENSTTDKGDAGTPGENSGKDSVSEKPPVTKEGNGRKNAAPGKGNTEKGGTASPEANKEETSRDTGKTPGSGDSKSFSGTGSDKNKNSGASSYQFTTVEKSYFDDALFIGDSRTVGLSEYSGWDNPTYYADVGLTIYDVFDKKIAEVNGKKTTIDKALEQQNFQKIYIMLGINELGRGTTKTFIEEYKKVTEKIQKLQPDAIIFVEGIMNVSKKKSDSDPIFNNKNIKDKNDQLALLADNKDIFYIDVNEAITDNTGGIPEKYTFDNIHLKAAYYSIWTDFLLKHGVVRE